MVLYSEDKNLNVIFAHVPKTGGTSIEKAFGYVIEGAHGKHSDIKEIRDFLFTNDKQDYYNQAFKFTIVRNPFDQLYSFWNYHTHLLKTSYFQFSEDFNQFLTTLNLRDKSVAECQVKPGLDIDKAQIVWGQLFQKPYAYIGEELQMDFIGRFEFLHRDFNLIKRITGLTSSLPHLNKAFNKKPYWTRYNYEGREIAEELLEEDLKTFGYEF
tara:strand:+ start:1272 stop:1907 length:636 start_codon:yes stop_codon:yes gene_type:complete